MKTKLKVNVLVLLVFSLMSAFGQEKGKPVEGEGDKTLSPYFFIQSDYSGTEQMPLKSTEAEVQILGMIAAVKVKQVYKNEGKQAIEAVYVFPASTRAAVHGMRMVIGERIIEADIREREKARQDYEQAKSAGKAASLLEQQRPNVFQMNVANIMPGDEIRVELDYTEMIIPEKGLYEFVFPTVVGPRYSNQPAMLASRDDQWIANPYTTEGIAPFYSFGIQCRINAGVPLSGLKCTSHKIDADYKSRTVAELRLKDASGREGNRDFILQYRLSGAGLQSGVLRYEDKDEKFFLAAVYPPAAVKTAQIPPREYVFIVDISGSMHGFPLDISKKLMEKLLKSLKPSDQFNVVLFAGGSALFSPASVQATSANISGAVAFVGKQQGGGGTELLPALQKALALNSSENLSRTFVIATDGYVSVEKEAFKLIRNNLNRANFFAFGIGSAVNRYLIEGIAHAGMGQAFVVTRREDADEMASAFMEYVQHPVLTNIKLTCKGFDAYDVEPLSIPDVFSERPVLVFGKYRDMSDHASITLSGTTGEGPYRANLLLADAGGRDNLALRYLWARERIRHLDDFGIASGQQDEQAVANQITGLGLQYNLLTRFTSFVAIDHDVRNKEGKVITVTQPLPLPEGVSNYAVGGGQGSGKGTVSYTAPGINNVKYCAPQLTTLDCDLKSADRTEVKENIQLETKSFLSSGEHLPEFPGGQAALQEYFRINLKYPDAARWKGLEGTVTISFYVNADGSLSDVKVEQGLGSGCDEEAVRLVKRMPKWKPAMKQGQAVRVKMTLPVRFAAD
ncbi:MAG TPA: TonB family protein [Bacteroidales bacterium]|nr:TonB family protein [Bacteroidales bacterium]HSA44641.1 TonB family protein [Bacteroidales bacterium]